MVSPVTLNKYYEDGGLIYPLQDTRARKVHHKTLDDMDQVISHCTKPDVVIQAGGNCGIWARKMSGIFKTVYTWEPDPINFGALAVNTAQLTNVVKFQAALGVNRNFVGMEYQAYGKIPDTLNCGATFVKGDGFIPTMRIDDIALPVCNLIYLDIEGYELFALRGAVDTIQRCRPVIACEDKGLSDRYGVVQGEIAHWLEKMDYKTIGIVRKDVILVPK